MRGHIEHAARRWGIRCVSLTLFVAGWIGLAPSVWGEVIRVEEDWEMVVVSPDPETNGPQTVCVISPTGGVDGVHAAFQINNWTEPKYAPGGLQLTTWDGERVISYNKAPQTAVMGTDGERVTWTQSMTMLGGNLIFEILDGHSATWGHFGGEGYLKIVTSTGLSNLDGYDPAVSVQHSGVGFARNRVQSLVLKGVRLIKDDGTVVEDNTVRTVH